MKPHERRWTAYHEAGHAVLRIARTGYATAMEIGAAAGRTGYSHGSGRAIRASDAIEIALAGPLAEARVRKVSFAHVLLTSGADDWVQAQEIAARSAMDKRSMLDEAERHARGWLRVHWQSVHRVAVKALAFDGLTDAQVKALAAIDN